MYGGCFQNIIQFHNGSAEMDFTDFEGTYYISNMIGYRGVSDHFKG